MLVSYPIPSTLYPSFALFTNQKLTISVHLRESLPTIIENIHVHRTEGCQSLWPTRYVQLPQIRAKETFIRQYSVACCPLNGIHLPTCLACVSFQVSKIGVFSCGPRPLTKSVMSACDEVNKGRQLPYFIHHFENFGWSIDTRTNLFIQLNDSIHSTLAKLNFYHFFVLNLYIFVPLLCFIIVNTFIIKNIYIRKTMASPPVRLGVLAKSNRFDFCLRVQVDWRKIEILTRQVDINGEGNRKIIVFKSQFH